MIVTLDALFSHNNMIGSKVIALGSKHLAKHLPNTSHVALLVNKRWVHESTGHSGVRVISIDKWKTINTEVARIELQPKTYQQIADKYRTIQSKKYDYLGVFFLALSIIPTFFGLGLPKKNLWEDKNKYFCCEALAYFTGQDYSMSTPVQILQKLMDK